MSLGPALRVSQAIRFFRQPAALKAAYLRSAAQRLAPEYALVRTLRRLVPDCPTDTIRAVIGQCLASSTVRSLVECCRQAPGTLSEHELVFLHSLVVLLKPDIIVETGVANGSSSAILLAALHENGAGILHSVDLPMVKKDGQIQALCGEFCGRPEETTVVPAFDRVGWLIPENLRDRWRLHLGDSLSILSNLLPQIGRVDLFLHDSLHTYGHMTAEFEIVWPFLRSGGVILADDLFVFEHAAVPDFARAKRVKHMNHFGMGLMLKQG